MAPSCGGLDVHSPDHSPRDDKFAASADHERSYNGYSDDKCANDEHPWAADDKRSDNERPTDDKRSDDERPTYDDGYSLHDHNWFDNCSGWSDDEHGPVYFCFNFRTLDGQHYWQGIRRGRCPTAGSVPGGVVAR
jgi:hypothetical protein